MTARANTCEGSNGTTVTTANTAPDQWNTVTATGTGTTIKFDTSISHNGASCIDFHLPANLAATATTIWTGLTSSAQGFFWGYLYLTAYPVGAAPRLFGLFGSGALRSCIRLNASGTLTILDSASGVKATMTAAVPLNQFVRVELDLTGIVTTTGNVAARMYSGVNLDGATPDTGGSISSAGITCGGNVDAVRVAVSSATTVTVEFDVRFDDCGYSDVAQPVRAFVIPDVISGTVTIPAPTITSSIASAPVVVSCAITIPQPVITSDVLITPSVIGCSISIPAPTVSAGSIVKPAVISCAVTIPTPIFIQSVLISPSTINGATTFPPATVSTATGASVTPATIMGTVSIFKPIIPALPATVAGAASVPAPAISTGIIAKPSVVSGSITLASPAVSCSVVVSAQVINGATIVNPVSVSTGSIVKPLTIAISAAIPGPLVIIAAMAKPSVILTTITISGPTIHTGGMASPSTISGMIVVSSPTLHTGSTVFASEIHLTTVFGNAFPYAVNPSDEFDSLEIRDAVAYSSILPDEDRMSIIGSADEYLKGERS